MNFLNNYGNATSGLAGVQGAKVHALRCEMDHARCDHESHGACAKGKDTFLALEDCDMHDNAGSGAAAKFGSQLSVRNCAASECGR